MWPCLWPWKPPGCNILAKLCWRPSWGVENCRYKLPGFFVWHPGSKKYFSIWDVWNPMKKRAYYSISTGTTIDFWNIHSSWWMAFIFRMLQTSNVKPSLFSCPNLDFTPTYSKTHEKTNRFLGGFRRCSVRRHKHYRRCSKIFLWQRSWVLLMQLLGSMGREHWLFG